MQNLSLNYYIIVSLYIALVVNIVSNYALLYHLTHMSTEGIIFVIIWNYLHLLSLNAERI